MHDLRHFVQLRGGQAAARFGETEARADFSVVVPIDGDAIEAKRPVLGVEGVAAYGKGVDLCSDPRTDAVRLDLEHSAATGREECSAYMAHAPGKVIHSGFLSRPHEPAATLLLNAVR